MGIALLREQTYKCPICRANKGERLLSIGEYAVLSCFNCGYLSTFPVLSSQRQLTKYNSDYYGRDNAQRFRWGAVESLQNVFRYYRARYFKRRLKRLEGRKVLDLGCGGGLFLYWLQRWGAEVFGVEIGSSAVRLARERVGATAIRNERIEDVNLSGQQFDLITVWHVLEHLENPVEILKKIAKSLKPDGYAYIEVPNAGGWSARALKSHWLAYDVPNHINHFTPTTLEYAARKAGLRRVATRHWSWEYSPFTLLQSLVNACLGGESILFRTMSYDRPYALKKRSHSAVILLGHIVAMIILSVPAVILSIVFSLCKQGDTFGVFLSLDSSCATSEHQSE